MLAVQIRSRTPNFKGLKMTPTYLHDSCMKVYIDCPQVRHQYQSYLAFKEMCNNIKVQYNTLGDVATYWLNNDILWQKGYSEELPEDVKNLFSQIRVERLQAIYNVCETNTVNNCDNYTAKWLQKP